MEMSIKEIKQKSPTDTPDCFGGHIYTVFFIKGRSDFSQGVSEGHCDTKVALAFDETMTSSRASARTHTHTHSEAETGGQLCSFTTP